MKKYISIVLPFNEKAEHVVKFISSIKLIGLENYRLIWLTADDSYQGELLASDDLIKISYSSKANSKVLVSFLEKWANSTYLLFCPRLLSFSHDFIEKLITPLANEQVNYTVAKLANAQNELIDAGGNQQLLNFPSKIDVFHPSVSYHSFVSSALYTCTMYRVDALQELLYKLPLTPVENAFTAVQCQLAQQGAYGLRVGDANGEVIGGSEAFEKVKRYYSDLITTGHIKAIDVAYCDFELVPVPMKGTVLMIDMQIPKPDVDAGSYAAYQEIKLIQSLGYHVKFVSAHLDFSLKYSRMLQQLGVEVYYGPYYSSANEVIVNNATKVNAIYITRYHIAQNFLDLIREYCPDIPVIFNNADLHFLRELRAAEANNDLRALELAEDTKASEVEVMEQVNVVLSYNEVEHQIIGELISDKSKIHKCPWVLASKAKGLSFEKRTGIAFLGGFKHAPNVEAIECFMQFVMPLLIEKSPHVKLYVYGSNMPESFHQYQCDQIELVGYVENLDDVFHSHRVFVAPLISGAGIKGKVLEAISYGVPCVLSPIAAEATGLVHEQNSLLANSPEQWLEYILALYNNQELWLKFSQKEVELTQSHYSFSNGRNLMKKAFEYVGLF